MTMDLATRSRVMLYLESRRLYDRIPAGNKGGGRFRGLHTLIIPLLKEWAKGNGPDDPIGEQLKDIRDPKQRRDKLRDAVTQLRKKALALGDDEQAARLMPRRGATEDELKALLYQDAKASSRIQRDKAAVEKPSAKFTLQNAPHAGKDVAVYRNKAGHVALYQETDAGQRAAHPLERFDSLDELHAWAREHNEKRLADWAHGELGGKTPDVAPAKKVAPVGKVGGEGVPRTRKAAPGKVSAPSLTGEEGLSSDPAVREVQVENRIRAAYANLKRGDIQWVGLAELRPMLGVASTADVDRALLHLLDVDGPGKNRLIPEENQKTITSGDRLAAISVGGEDKHLISIADSSLRPLPASPSPRGAAGKGVPAARPRKIAAPKSLMSQMTPDERRVARELGLPDNHPLLALAQRIDEAPTRAEAEALIAHVHPSDLNQVAKEVGIELPPRLSADEKRAHIVQSLISYGNAGAEDAAKRRPAAPDGLDSTGARQAKRDVARTTAEALTEADELVHNGASLTALEHRLNTRRKLGSPDPVVDDLIAAARTGDRTQVDATLDRLAREHGLTPVETAGKVVPFDRTRHEVLGGDIPEGTPVLVQRRGYRYDDNGQQITVSRAVVVPAPGKAAKKAAPGDAARERAALEKDIIRRYVGGASIQEVATSSGRSPSSVHSILTKNGIQLRPRGGSRKATGSPAAAKKAAPARPPSIADLEAALEGIPTIRQKRAQLRKWGFTEDQINQMVPLASKRSEDLDEDSEIRAEDEFDDDEEDDEEDLEDEDDEPEMDVEEDYEPLAPAARSRAMAMRAIGHDVTPGHDELHHWWVYGEGRARWHTWTELHTQLLKHVPPEKAERFASAWFQERYGYASGSDLNRVKHGKPPRGHLVGPG